MTFFSDARLVLGAGKGVLFREVRGVLIERDSTDMYILESLTQV